MDNIMSLLKSRKQTQTTEEADAARDAGDWVQARKGYERFLSSSPNRHDIWVQLGHARKETGDLPGAEAAYRQSLALNDAVADTHLQLGHVLKMLKRQEEAIEAYGKAVEVDPKLTAAWRELRAYGIEGQSTQSAQPRILVDLSDVFFYLRHHSTVSGIQRVQLGLARSLIGAAEQETDVVFLTELDDHSGYVEVDRSLILNLIRTLNRPKVSVAELRKLGAQAASDGMRYAPAPGDLLLVLGAFWVLSNVIEQIISLKAKGVRVGVMIHDIIPITHPEFCERELTDTFNLYVRSVFKVVDLIISISKHTQSEVEKLLDKEKIARPAMFVLPNAHSSWTPQKRVGTAVQSAEVSEIIQNRYVLYVSTIEVRKNHTLLFRAWKKLQERLGADTPRLVFVGRPGWRVRDLMDQIVGTDYLNGLITILHDIPDIDLELLYKNCMFTTFPSFVEGWGLPVGESLMFGKPCVASSASSIPEVGGDFVEYVDPFNLDDAVGVFEKLITNGQYLKQRTDAIVSTFKLRTWDDAAQDLLSEASRFVGDSTAFSTKAPAPVVPVLAPGKKHAIGHGDDRSNYINFGLGPDVHFLFDEHWYPVENFGRWVAGGNGSISFAVPQSSQGKIRILLTLSQVGWYNRLPVQIFCGGKPLKTFVPNESGNTSVLFDADASSGLVKLSFYVKGSIKAGEDPRKDLSIGLVSLAYAGLDDLPARLLLLEELLFDRPDLIRLRPRDGHVQSG